MRNLMALLFLLSLCGLHLVFSAPTGLDYKTVCCGGTTTMRIPERNIVKYWGTSSNCPIKAIVFETPKNKFCLNPKTAWVIKYMKEHPNSATTSL
ncbi:C-C motif chemokine 4-like isoform X2 [Tachysurus fulvidraco]|uniref:C-C motif chemokine 4-like isoform X2 n=1 Tax=Tachysurus fulvidraco TaxID=1234273 RepID=UPI001FEE616F|nr:C-C motif chemokine 4-like isoform X2 [Tachysurus fulvidraco]